MEDNIKQFKTPSYILRAVHNYNKKNNDLINQKAREKYAKSKKENTAKKPSRYSLMTPEAKDAYKAKQRTYYQARKEKEKHKQQLLIEDKDKDKEDKEDKEDTPKL